MVSRNARYRASNFPVSSMCVPLRSHCLAASFPLVGTSLARRDQAPQTAVDVGTPRVGADIETFIFGNQTQMREADFRLLARLGKLENNLRALPLGFVFRKAEIVVQNKPDHFLAGNDFDQSYFAAMDVFVAIRKLVAEFAGLAFNFFRPPSTNINDGREGLFRRLV